MNEDCADSCPRYFSVKQIAEEIPAFTEAALRKLIANYQKNGLSEAGAIIKVGRKVIIDKWAFEEWLNWHRELQEFNGFTYDDNVIDFFTKGKL